MKCVLTYVELSSIFGTCIFNIVDQMKRNYCKVIQFWIISSESFGI